MSFRTDSSWRSLSAAVAGRRYRLRAAKPRRWVPCLDHLEGRVVPTVVGNLYVVGSTLVYNGNLGDNVISLSGTGGSLSLTDSAGMIVSNVPGMPSSGDSVSGTIPSYIQTIAVNGQNGVDTITVANGFSTTRNVTLSATLINNSGAITTRNLTETANTIELGGAVSTAAGPIGGSATFNGTVVTTAATSISTTSVTNGNVTFNGAVTSTNPLTINAGNTGSVFTDQSIVVANNSDFDVTNAGSIHLAGTTVDGNVALTAQGGVTLAGTLIDSNAGDSIIINANQGGTGAAGFYQASGTVVATGTLVVINVGGTANAQLTNITTAAGGTVIVNAGGAIQNFNGNGLNVDAGPGGSLDATAGVGGIDLNTAVGSVSASTTSATPLTSPITINNNGQPLTVDGLTTTNGAVTLTNNGEVVVSGPVTAGGPNQTVAITTTAGTGAGDVTVTDGASISALGTVTINTPGAITSTGGSTPAVSAPTVNLTASTGIAGTIGPFGTSLPLDAVTVSATTNTGGIALANDAALTVDQATSNGGAITITTPLGSIPNPNDLIIKGNVSTTGNAITLQAGDSLNVLQGAIISSDQPVVLDAEYNLNLDAGSQVVSSGNITVDDGLGTFPLGSIPSVIDVSGSVVTSGTVSITTGIAGDLVTVAGPVIATGGLTIYAGQAANTLILTPSTATAYTIDLSYPYGSGTPSGFANTIVINAPQSTVATATPSGVTFTGLSGYRKWTILGFSAADGDTIPPFI